jgi:hypothetical protein
MGTETALHILCECVALDEPRLHRLDKHFMRTSDYDSFPQDARYCTLLEVWDYWWNKADGDAQQIRKWSCARVALHAHPITIIRILISFILLGAITCHKII